MITTKNQISANPYSTAAKLLITFSLFILGGAFMSRQIDGKNSVYKNWLPTEGIITNIETGSTSTSNTIGSKGSSSASYTIITYTYKVGNDSYEGRTKSYAEFVNSKGNAISIGCDVNVLYDPKQTYSSVVMPLDAIPFTTRKMFIAAASVFALGLACLILQVISKKRNSAKIQKF